MRQTDAYALPFAALSANVPITDPKVSKLRRMEMVSLQTMS